VKKVVYFLKLTNKLGYANSFSSIIPTYNREILIGEMLDSVLAQKTYTNIDSYNFF
jgi:hypothetical protein